MCSFSLLSFFSSYILTIFFLAFSFFVFALTRSALSIFILFNDYYLYSKVIIAELSGAKRAQRSTMGKKMRQYTHSRKFGNHVTVHRPSDRPSAPQAYQCKISQSTGIATQLRLEVILVGNRLATRVV